MTTTTAPAIAGYTTTEAETLATLMTSALRHMSTAHKYTPGDVLGGYAWAGTAFREAAEDLAAGFYSLMNDAIAAGAPRDLGRIYL
jgi:hypothetical protein